MMTDAKKMTKGACLPAYEVTFTFTYFSILSLHRFTISKMIITSFASATLALQ